MAKYMALGVLGSVSIEPGVTNELSSHGSLRKEHAWRTLELHTLRKMED